MHTYIYQTNVYVERESERAQELLQRVMAALPSFLFHFFTPFRILDTQTHIPGIFFKSHIPKPRLKQQLATQDLDT